MQLGSRRSASIPNNVGAILSRGQRHCVSPRQLSSSQPRFYSPPARFIVDSADREALPAAKEELKLLLEKPTIEGIPLLILGNKSDLPEHMTVDELIAALDLKTISHREVSCYGISAKEETNLDHVLNWLISRASH